MRRFRLIGIMVVALSSALVLIHCSEKDKGTNAGPKTVEVTGTVSFPAGTSITLSELAVGFADSDNAVDSSGSVKFTGTEHLPGLGMVMDQSGSALMLGVDPDPVAGQTVEFNARSTAKALVFMNPFVCENDRANAVQAMADIEELAQVDTLENLLKQKLAADPNSLNNEDSQLEGIITRAIEAYVDMHEQSSRSPVSGKSGSNEKPATATSTNGTVLVIPTTQTSGHLVTHVSDNTFNITNAYGRWALLYVPQTGKQIYLSPNGSMLDFFYDGLPWAPSNTTFNLTVDQPDDTQKVFVYGYGLKNDADSYWSSLTDSEKRMVDKAGMFTFVFELLGGTVDVLCAVNSSLSGVDGWEAETEHFESEVWLLDFMLNDAWDMSQIHTMLNEGRYGDLAWFVFKTVFEKITTDETYRLKIEALMGKTLSEKQLKRMEWLASNPATYAIGAGINIGNKVTNVMKTAYGIRDARFKTVFKIWKSNEDFGGITGHVMQKEAPFGPIAGANVHLSGDDNNPIPGHVTDVTTDADGGFMFANVMAGAKTLTATKAGYSDKSVAVTVTKNQVASVTIEMSKRVGTVKGIVVNEIYSKARQVAEYASHDTLFDKQLFVYARGRVADQPYEDSRTIYNGRYSFDLPEGTFWIVAIHPDNDYKPDSMQVTTVLDEIHDAARALRMKPICTASATITPIGGVAYDLVFDSANASQPFHDASMNAVVLAGFTPGTLWDEIDFWVNTNKVNSPNLYNAGTLYSFAMGNLNFGGYAVYGTNRLKCQQEGHSYDMIFRVIGDPDEEGCDCGISTTAELGTIYFSKFGDELGDVIQGDFSGTLAGWKNCECNGEDTDHDGKNDTWDAVCQNLAVRFEFKVVVGSKFYFVSSSPAVDIPVNQREAKLK